VVFYFALVGVTLLVLAALRRLFPLRPGIYSYRLHPKDCYIWNLHGYLCITNLAFLYLNPVFPPAPSLLFPVSRKQVYAALGARMGRGLTTISGHLSDPWLVSIATNAIVGEGALLLPHLIGRGKEDLLLLGRIEIGEDSIIGARSVILPGVRIGRGATVQPMSVVKMSTSIGEGEIWGGNPARKLGEIPTATATRLAA
jgi:acetyltransferase-like isoleucine patch superfamily enzyme